MRSTSPAAPRPGGAPLRVLIVANYSADAITSNNRFNDLARRFAARGAEVELVTSAFSHARKSTQMQDMGETSYTLTRLHEPGYSRNISPARLRSQAVFARSVARYLGGLERRPHLILAATPPPAVAQVCVRYAREHGIPCAVDVQDLWPEAFAMVARFPRLIDLAFRGMRRQSAEAYAGASRVIGVSRTYVEAAVRAGADPGRTDVVRLGTDLAQFDRHAHQPEPGSGAGAESEARTGKETGTAKETGSGTEPGTDPRERRPSGDPGATPVIGYVGGLSDSYDLPLVLEALAQISRDPSGPPVPSLVVMGDGSRRGQLEEQARAAGLDVRFTGNLPYAQMVRTLVACHIAVNPIVAGSAGSILNKAGDYAAAGLPVISSQESPEYRELLAEHGAGISCPPGDVPRMAEAILRLSRDPALRGRMGRASRRLAETHFDRAATYEAMIDDLLALVGTGPDAAADAARDAAPAAIRVSGEGRG